MLGFIPRPVKDELVYSILARYRFLAGSQVSGPTIKNAFGRDAKYIHISMPGRLRHLAEMLPGNLTAERLAVEHSFLPYYERFASSVVRDRMMSGLIDGWKTGGYDGLGAIFAQVNGHAAMNFCPACVTSDQKAFGTSAWRRVHQLPGVFLCPEHGKRLRTTGVSTTNQAQLVECPAKPMAGEVIPLLLHRAAAQSVAENSLWLLRNPGPPTDPATLRAGVRAMLRDAGWIGKTNMVRPGLRQAVAEKLGANHLEKLGCRLGLVGNRDAWLGWTWEDRPEIRAHPLRYLLILAFLERNAADLFAFVGKPLPNDVAVVLNRRRPGVTHRSHPERPAIIQKHRDLVLSAIASHPSSSRTDIRRLVDPSTRYLGIHDQKWLQANLPPERSKAKSRDWSAFDRDLLPKVEAAIARLTAQPGRPVRITASAIDAEARKGKVLLSERERLPLCTAAVQAAAEGDLAFARRRLDWAANELVMSGQELMWTQLVVLGRLSGPTRPLLEPYARELYRRMRAAKPGEPLFAPGEPERVPKRRSSERAGRFLR